MFTKADAKIWFQYKFYLQDIRKKPYNIISFALQCTHIQKVGFILLKISYPQQHFDKYK